MLKNQINLPKFVNVHDFSFSNLPDKSTYNDCSEAVLDVDKLTALRKYANIIYLPANILNFLLPDDVCAVIAIIGDIVL